ncbi:acyl-CoA dehydrogenase family protein, partial [Streptomyces sp. NPDC054932]
MRFLPTDEQSAFARTLRSLLAAAEVPAAVRAWADGKPDPGRALWAALARTGLFALAVPERWEGAGLLPLEMSLGFVELGRAGVPGPVVESAAVSVLLSELGDESLAQRFLPGLAGGETSATLILPGGSPYALDADAATYLFTVSGAGELRLVGGPGGGRDGAGGAGEPLRSTDPARR